METYIYIYAVGSGALVRGLGNAAAAGDDALIIYNITVTPDDATVIGEIDNETMRNGENEKAGAWYDLNGRILQRKPTERGIYIRNGRKVLVK